jgi:hypothetical protein
MDILVRTYPQRIAGSPLYYNYDRATRLFCLHFAGRDGVTGPAEISIPVRRFHPDGFEIFHSDDDGTRTS